MYQEKLFKQIAKDNDIPYKTVLEIFRKTCEKIAIEMANHEVDELGVKDIDSFRVIHIQNFGKFIPHNRQIKAANNQILSKHGKHKEGQRELD
jgi:nucleoid DNA-binding protein